MPAVDAPDDELPKVTLAHLRDAETLCAFRLRADHHNVAGDTGSNAAFTLARRLENDIQLAHADLAPARAGHFRADGLVPEAAATYDAAARWYLELFGAEPVRAADDADWSTIVPALGVRLVGPAGLPFEDAHDRPHLRFFRLAARDPLPPDLTTWAPLRFALLRRRAWLAGRAVLVEVADLLQGQCASLTVGASALDAELDSWLAARVALIRERIEEPIRRRGIACGWCTHVALCESRR